MDSVSHSGHVLMMTTKLIAQCITRKLYMDMRKLISNLLHIDHIHSYIHDLSCAKSFYFIGGGQYRNYHYRDKTVDRLIFIMEIPIPGKTIFILRQDPVAYQSYKLTMQCRLLESTDTQSCNKCACDMPSQYDLMAAAVLAIVTGPKCLLPSWGIASIPL